MEEARLRSHVIAIKNYENYRILSSSILFSELIHGHTFKIKLNIHIIKNILFDYYKKRGLDEKLASEKCSKTLLKVRFRIIKCKIILFLFS